MVEQLFTAKRRRIEAEIATTNRSREFLPEPHSPKDLDSRPSTKSVHRRLAQQPCHPECNEGSLREILRCAQNDTHEGGTT